MCPARLAAYGHVAESIRQASRHSGEGRHEAAKPEGLVHRYALNRLHHKRGDELPADLHERVRAARSWVFRGCSVDWQLWVSRMLSN
jgi:hypothetical protein